MSMQGVMLIDELGEPAAGKGGGNGWGRWGGNGLGWPGGKNARCEAGVGANRLGQRRKGRRRDPAFFKPTRLFRAPVPVEAE